MPTPRTTLRLTERDDALLESLGSYRFLTAPQAAALLFPSRGAAEARLRALLAHDLVVRVFMPVRPYDRTAVSIWALSARGARRVAEAREGARPAWLSPADRRSALFLDHTLRRNDVRACLEVLDRDQRGFQLLRWAQTPDEVRGAAVVPVGRGARARVPVVPDGFFAVRHRGKVHAFCVEIDMGTVSPAAMARRYRAYWAWWKLGGMAWKFGGAPMRVLTLAPTEARLARLRGLAAAAPPGTRRGSGLFWFAPLTAADIAAPERLLAGPWLDARAGPAEPRPLLDEPDEPTKPYEQEPPDGPAPLASADAAPVAHARPSEDPEVPRVREQQRPVPESRFALPLLLVPEAHRRVGVSARKRRPRAGPPPFAPRRRTRAWP